MNEAIVAASPHISPDALNRLTSLTSGGAFGVVTFTYDALSRRTSMTLPNGTVANYTYDAASQLTSLVHEVGGTPIASSSYTYDQLGNRTSLTDLDGTHDYLYDGLNRLVQATHPQAANPEENFTYDPVGNRIDSHLANGQVHDLANRLLEDSNFIYTYDANGNLTVKTSKVTGEQTVYTYDSENQLIRVERFTLAGGATPVLVAEYRYDPLGRRIEKVVNGVSTRFVYDNEDIVAEVDGTGATQAISLHGPGIDEPLAVVRRTEAGFNRFIYHADGLGSISTLTDLNGDPVRTYTYDSFGRIVDETGTVIDPYTYTAREFDPETGLFYYRARYYDPTIGRFLQEDPIGFVGGPNFYAYVRGNPHGFIDPLGLQPIAGIDDVIRIRPGSIAVGTSIGILDLSWNTDNPSAVTFRATTPQLGAGIGFCRDFRPLLDEEDGVNTDLIAAEGTCKRFAGERSRSMPAEQPLIEKPFTYIVGQRWQGVSFQDNFSRICFNVGPSIALFPVNVSLDLFTQEEPSPSL